MIMFNYTAIIYRTNKLKKNEKTKTKKNSHRIVQSVKCIN